MVRVDEQVAARAITAVRVLAELTPAVTRRDDSMRVPLDWFRWLDGGLELFSFPDLGGPRPLHGQGPELPTHQLDRVFGERLAAVQQVRSWNSSVRIGWLWLAGTAVVVGPDGEETRKKVFRPLVTRPVRVAKALLRWQLEINGDPEISALVTDGARARELEARIEYGGGAIRSFGELTPALLDRLTRLKSFARECAAAAGFDAVTLSTSRIQPEDAMRHEGVQLIVGLGVYVVDDAGPAVRADHLLAWRPDAFRSATAFHAVYAGHATDAVATPADLETPLPLTERQVEAVTSSRAHALTVISGAPGTGKSHTLTSIVWDALRRGDSVLVTAKSEGAVDALTDLFERQPGVTPVVFGSAERRAQLAHRLSSGHLRVASSSDLRRAEQALGVAIERRDHARAAARRTLLEEWLRTDAGVKELEEATRAAPHARTASPALLADLVGRCHGEVDGWRARRRRARDERVLRRLVGAPIDAELASVLQAIEFSAAVREAVDSTPTDACLALEGAEEEVRRCLREWLALETRSAARLNRPALAAISTLATALRSGRSARRAQLERLRDDSLTQALPVWIGTLGDVDDLLPAIPGLFDLVLIDEASSTEQTVAAAALLRGERGVVVGDPHQLRHVSFLADAQLTDVFDRNRVAPEDRSQLDVRRNSVFDAAAAASPVVVLDEHFRSAPHLIDVVADAIYDGQLFVATRTPRTQSIDCVTIESVKGTRSKAGVVDAEVDAVVGVLRRLRAKSSSVGVVTPFRAQADALEEAVLRAFTAEQLVQMDLRISTAHGFQGNERDVVVCSLGLVDDDTRGWGFASDPHLLAVMLTRARRSMIVVTGCHPEPTSLLGRYLAAADSPPGPPPPAAALSPWAQSIVADLRLAGLAPSEAYPTGRHVVDAAVDVGAAPVAVICELHPQGIDAHIDRHLALHRAGWRTMDALRSGGEAAAMRTVEIVNRIRALS